MQSWAPLWNGLVDSSIWEEPDHVFRVFMAMMSLKDANHIVSLDGYKLARRIHMEVGTVEEALKILSEPDKRRPEQEHEGRRIKKVDDGWLILNGELYRKLVAEEMRRTRNRRAQKAFREKRKGTRKGKPLPGEAAAIAAMERGDHETAEKIAGERTEPET